MRHAREGVRHIWAGIVDVKKRRKTGEKAAYLDRDRRCREKKKKKKEEKTAYLDRDHRCKENEKKRKGGIAQTVGDIRGIRSVRLNDFV